MGQPVCRGGTFLGASCYNVGRGKNANINMLMS